LWLSIGLFLSWAIGLLGFCSDRLFHWFSVNRTEEPGYFGSRESGTEQELIFSVPVLSVPVPGSFDSVLGSRFFVPSARWHKTQSPATGSLHRCRPRRWSRCRNNPVRGTASGRSVVQLPNNLEPAPRRRRLEDVRVKTTDTLTRVRTSKPTPIVMPRHSLGWHRRTSPLQPCCCAAVRRPRPPRKGEYASN
jgi:hypothetical protein